MADESRKRLKFKGRSKGPPFLAIEHRIAESDEFGALSSYGLKLLLELAMQYRPGKNGDLSIPWSRLKRRGWRSQSTVLTAKRELLERGWIIETRMGGRNLCGLYALTYYAIDESDKHLEPGTVTPPNLWQQKRKG